MTAVGVSNRRRSLGPPAWLRAALGTVALWHQRARQRRQLSVLEDRLYSDIGVTAGDAYRESRKPFWRA